jgi:hypothetical protein
MKIHGMIAEWTWSQKLKILHPIFLLFYTAAWSKQRPLSCWSWHGRNDFRLLINRTCKLLAKVLKWSSIVCLLLLTAMKNPEKYECGSLRVKISECGRFHTPVRERTGKWEISGILSFVREGWQVWIWQVSYNGVLSIFLTVTVYMEVWNVIISIWRFWVYCL